jgi:hypothetical protein
MAARELVRFVDERAPRIRKHGNGAGVNALGHVGLFHKFQDIAGSIYIDAHRRLLVSIIKFVPSGGMEYSGDTIHGRAHAVFAGNVAHVQPHSQPFKIRGLMRRAYQGHDVVARCAKLPDNATANEPASAGDKVPHDCSQMLVLALDVAIGT